MIIFALPGYEALADSLSKSMKWRRGRLKVSRFSNFEMYVEIPDRVRGEQCLIIGGTNPPEQNALSLFIAIHTLKKERAGKVIVLIPYLGYSRQDKNKRGESWSTKWLGDVFFASGADRIITIDVHSKWAKQLFRIPLISISPYKIFAKVLKRRQLGGMTVVAPDNGALDNCRDFRKALKIGTAIAYFEKKRTHQGIQILNLHGKLSEKAILVDDILDTGETLVSSAKRLRQAGVKEIIVVVTHALFTGNLWKKLWKFGVKKIYCTDSFLQKKKFRNKKIDVVPVSEILKDYFWSLD